MHSALSRDVTHFRWYSPLSLLRVGIGVYIPQRADYVLRHADKPGRENEWVAPTELPSMRCSHANKHDNRRKVMSDRMA